MYVDLHVFISLRSQYVFQGILDQYETEVTEADDFLKVWSHFAEGCRAISQNIVTEEDLLKGYNRLS